jgi:hypothetical protein
MFPLFTPTRTTPSHSTVLQAELTPTYGIVECCTTGIESVIPIFWFPLDKGLRCYVKPLFPAISNISFFSFDWIGL